LQFPAIWKLLAEFEVQFPLGSKPRKLFQQEIIFIVAGNHLFIPENKMFNYEKKFWKIQRGFYDRKLTWQPLWNEVIVGSGVGFAVIYFRSAKSSLYPHEIGNKLQKTRG
jgi:hypothetical protein